MSQTLVPFLRRHLNPAPDGPLLRGAQVVKQLARESKEDRIGGLAAEVAFFGLLSVFPGLLAVAAGLGVLDRLTGAEVAERAEGQVVEVLTTFLADSAQGTIDAVRELFANANAGVLTFGVLGAVWGVSRGMAAVLRALSEIYDYEETRSGLRRRAVAVGLALGSTLLVVLILVMVVLGPLFGLGRGLAGAIGLEDVYRTLWNWLALPVAFVTLLMWSALVFHAVPHRHAGWRHHFAGAALTGVLWLAVSVGFRLYLHFVGGNEVFRVLGGALVVVLWLYMLSVALLIGAELNAVVARGRPCDGAGARPSSESDLGGCVARGRVH